MSSPLRDRVAFVTGASRGIGSAIVHSLAREGCHVVIAAKTAKPHKKLPGTIHSVAEEIRAAYPDVEALPIRCNLRHEEDIHEAIEETQRKFGRLDILVNNAGAAWWYPVEETPSRKFDLVMNVNFRASHIATRAVLPSMKKHGYGHIINIAPPLTKPSMAAHKCAYMVSKLGMTYLVLALKEELEGENIAAQALWPVTMVESMATIHFGLGTKEDWRKPSIMGDATAALVQQNPSDAQSGRAWLDEEVLTELEGRQDFTEYACVPGHEPKKIPW